jgi:hypothetical protein
MVYAGRLKSDSTILRYFENNIVVFPCAFALPSPVSRIPFPRLAVSIAVNPLDPQQLKTWLLAAGKRDAAAFRSLYDAS